MCLLYYFICPKCYCGFPRYTDSCRDMHPPLHNCPRGTQFKFFIADEEDCYHYPHKYRRQRQPHPDSRAAGVPADLSHAGSKVEAIAQLPFTANGADGKAGGFFMTTPIPLAGASQSAQQLDERYWNKKNSLDCSWRSTGSHTEGTHSFQAYGQRDAYSRPSYRSFRTSPRGRGGSSSKSRLRRESRERKNFYQAQEWHEVSPFRGQYADRGDVRARDDVQYQYYQDQAAQMQFSFYGASRNPLSVTGPNQYSSEYRYRSNALNDYWNPDPSQIPNPVYVNTVGTTQYSPFGWDNMYRQPVYPQPEAVRLFGKNGTIESRRQENLEQLRRSNTAAYGNYNYSYPDQTQASSSQDIGDVLSIREPIPVENTQAQLSIIEDTGVEAEIWNFAKSRPRSWSDSYAEKVARMNENVSAQQQSTSQSEEDSQESNNKRKGKEIIRTETTTRNDNNENNVYQVFAGQMEQKGRALWCDEVEDALEDGKNFIKVPSIEQYAANSSAANMKSTGSNNAHIEGEEYGARNVAECATPGGNDNYGDNVNRQDNITGPSQLKKSALTNSNGAEFSTDGEYGMHEFPGAPPNSPIHTADERMRILMLALENESQLTANDNEATGFEHQSEMNGSSYSGREASQVEAPVKGTPIRDSTNIEALHETKTIKWTSQKSDISGADKVVTAHDKPSMARPSGPATNAPVKNSWSAVVTGAYVPSKAPLITMLERSATPTSCAGSSKSQAQSRSYGADRTLKTPPIPMQSTSTGSGPKDKGNTSRTCQSTPSGKTPASSEAETLTSTATNKVSHAKTKSAPNTPPEHQPATKTWASLFHKESTVQGDKQAEHTKPVEKTKQNKKAKQVKKSKNSKSKFDKPHDSRIPPTPANTPLITHAMPSGTFSAQALASALTLTNSFRAIPPTGSETASPASASARNLRGAEVTSVASGTSITGSESTTRNKSDENGMATPTVHSAPSTKSAENMQAAHSAQSITNESIATSTLDQSITKPKTTQTKAARQSAAAATPQQLLWSQVLVGPQSMNATGPSTVRPTSMSKSDGEKDETNWPSLGSSGPQSKRKR